MEYVGDIIDRKELHARQLHMNKRKDQNYYFLGITSQLFIDAGPRGNASR
jgi:hypothetical protein